MDATPTSSAELSIGPSITQTENGLRIEMKAPRAWPIVGFLAVWLGFWTFGGVTAMKALVTGGLGWASLFLLVWLAGWAAGEVGAAALFAFLLGGSEVLTVGGGTISRGAEVFGRGFTWRYPLGESSNFRPVSADGGQVLDLLAFECAGKTIRLGSNLYESGAKRIAEAVWRQAPSLRPKSE